MYLEVLFSGLAVMGVMLLWYIHKDLLLVAYHLEKLRDLLKEKLK